MHKNSWITLLSLLVAFLAVGNAQAFELKPMAAYKHTYNNNLFFDYDPESWPERRLDSEDSYATFTYGVLAREQQSNFKLDLSGYADMVRYNDRDYSNLDATDLRYHGNLVFMPSEYFTYKLNGGYVRDSSNERIEDIGRLDRQSLFGLTKQKRTDGGTGVECALSHTFFAGIDYKYNRTDYQDPRDTDNRTNRASLYLRQQWTPIFSTVMSVGSARYDYDDLTLSRSGHQLNLVDKVWSDYAMVGLAVKADQLVTFTANIGRRSSTTEYNRHQFYDNDFNYWYYDDRISRSTTGDLGLHYKDKMSNLSLTYSKDLQPGSGDSQAYDRISMRLDAGYRWAEGVALNLTAEYLKSSSDHRDMLNLSDYTNEETRRLNPRISYDFGYGVIYEVGYSYTKLRDRAYWESAYGAFRDRNKERKLSYMKLIWEYDKK